MKTPWTMQDYNENASVGFRPVDIFDAHRKLLFRISDGAAGVEVAKRIVESVNAQALLTAAGLKIVGTGVVLHRRQ